LGEPPRFPQSQIAVMPFEGGEPIKLIARPPRTGRFSYRWMPDGQALSFIDSTDGVSNIWRQPLDGSPPTKITDFKSEGVSGYDWSRDGKKIVFARNQTRSDVVAITNFR
jgi:dipeptidyl aminopeptidase/acylaminoacyl peptidase